jgi:ribosome biogenesis GTPase
LNEKNEALRARLTDDTEEATVGDLVEFEIEDEQHYRVTRILERHSFLSRTFGKATRRIAANIDHLFIVTAPEPLMNTEFMDRVLTAAFQQQIPTSLIFNKTDLQSEFDQETLVPYRAMKLAVFETDALSGTGMAPLLQAISNPSLTSIALTGLSGVGKSTILNQVIPEAARRTGQVSVKTGQGKQTTTQSFAYRFARGETPDLFIIDLPGIQNFGISSLEPRDVELSFTDFEQYRSRCEYVDCFHLEEPVCGVKEALEQEEVSPSRYYSYLAMLEEIERMREY